MSTSVYAAWVSWLEAFRRGEDPPTDHLGAITPEMGSYVEARLVDRIAGAFAVRVRHWQGTLGTRIVSRPPSDAAEAAALLREVGPRLEPLARLAASPLLPAPLGACLRRALAEVRDGARSALDDAWRRRVEETGDAGLAAAVPRPRGPSGAGAPAAPGARDRVGVIG